MYKCKHESIDLGGLCRYVWWYTKQRSTNKQVNYIQLCQWELSNGSIIWSRYIIHSYIRQEYQALRSVPSILFYPIWSLVRASIDICSIISNLSIAVQLVSIEFPRIFERVLFIPNFISTEIYSKGYSVTQYVNFRSARVISLLK